MKRRNSSQSQRSNHVRSPRLEWLEPRCLLATFTVNNPGDYPLGPNPHHDDTGQVHNQHGNPTGQITLRSAIEQIDVDGGGSISFKSGLTITIRSALDAITASGVTINGGKLGNVIISGGPGYDGLALSGGGATIENLVINGFDGTKGAGGNGNAGLVLASSNNTVQNDYIGTNSSGSSGVPNTNGIYITSGGNTVKDSVISGNKQFGIWVRGAPNNQIFGNKIGTDPKGTTAVPNGDVGIYMSATAKTNTIGGTSASKRNIISGNGYAGIVITCEGPVKNVVEGNYVGVDATGATALANGVFGDQIRGGSIGNIIGGTTASARNVISGNGAYGVGIGESGTSANVVEGNYIGTDSNGTVALPNGGDGVLVSDARSNTIGGAAAGAGNVISGNVGNGVHISANNAATSDTVAGNKIGVDPSFHPLANSRSGVFIDGAGGNTVGGVAAGAANVISGNGVEGVLLAGNGAIDNTVLGNFIGTDPKDDELPNGDAGVYINAVPKNVIGGPDGAGEAGQNVIRYNANAGVQIDGSAATGNTVTGNDISSNGSDGVLIHDAQDNIIGRAGGGDPSNIIADNGGEGIHVNGQDATGTRIENNAIGAWAATGQTGNTLSGILIEYGSDNVIGGDTAAADNTIAGNGRNGVTIVGDTATANTIVGNSIGRNARLGIDLGNDGITPMAAPQPIAGPNQLQNYPVLYSVTTDAFSGDVDIQGFLRGIAGTDYQIQFYANATLDPLQLSEGQEFLGAVTVTAGVTGLADISATIGAPADGTQYITATATDPDGNTSEFSPCRDILRGSVQVQVNGASITATFHPTVYVTSLAQAAQICGVNHFNWEQVITDIPDDWTWFTYQNTAAVTWQAVPIFNAAGAITSFFVPAVPVPITPVPTPITDPIDTPPDHYGVHSNNAAAIDPAHYPAGDILIGDPGPVMDSFPFYYNEDNGVPTNPGDISDPTITTPTELNFFDRPSMPEAFYSGGADAFEAFQTSLAGVMDDFDHTAIIWEGIQAAGGSTTQFTWKSNAKIAPPTGPPAPGGTDFLGYIAVWNSSGLPPVASGTVSNVGYADASASSTPVTLSLSQTVGPEPGRVGQNLTYTFTVTNTSTTAAKGVALDDKLPAGATVVSVKPSQGSSAQVKDLLMVELGSLAGGASATVTLIVTPTISGKLTNAARVTDPNGDGGTPPIVLTHDTVVSAVPPLFRFARSSYSVVETAKSVKITINRVAGLSKPASVTVAPAGGTAAAGLNYRFHSTVVNFLPNQSSATVIVSVLDDRKHHGNKTLKLSLFSPTSHAVYGMTTLTIQG
jgi:uncharacterized repeat protein (TIGR01451 family)